MAKGTNKGKAPKGATPVRESKTPAPKTPKGKRTK